MPEPPPDTGAKPAAANVSDNHAPIGVEKPAIESGVAIGRRTGLLTVSRPSPLIEAGETFTPARPGIDARNASRSASAVSGVSRGNAATRRGVAAADAAVASTISAIGVMPAMGAFANWPMEYATAPTRRPSMYTGLPLIPAMTPVFSSPAPSSRARMT